MNKPLLDEQCKNIFQLFLWSKNPVRFNELHRTLEDIGLKMSQPTLIEHLHHLLKAKLLVRKREGKQNVTYAANWTKLETFQQSMETKQILENLLRNEKQFKACPIDDQVTYVTNLFTLRSLHQLKLEVQDVIDPSKLFEHSIQFLFTARFFEIFKRWLLESCHVSKTEKAQEVLSMIDHNINHIANILFDEISQKQTDPSPNQQNTKPPRKQIKTLP